MIPIITQYMLPPVPVRDYDWAAWRDGDDESGPFGYGATEQDAINDLAGYEQ